MRDVQEFGSSVFDGVADGREGVDIDESPVAKLRTSIGKNIEDLIGEYAPKIMWKSLEGKLTSPETRIELALDTYTSISFRDIYPIELLEKDESTPIHTGRLLLLYKIFKSLALKRGWSVDASYCDADMRLRMSSMMSFRVRPVDLDVTKDQAFEKAMENLGK